MTTSPEQEEYRPPLPHRREQAPIPATVSTTSIRILWAGIAIVVLLFASEIAHYLVATHLTALDTIPEVAASHHPQCQELGGPYNLRCGQPGFNSVTMICWEFRCYYGDPNLPTITEPMRKQHAAEITEDAMRSLRVEVPYNEGSEEWQRNARSLVKGQRDSSRVALPLTEQAKTIPDAQLLVIERSQAISRNIAEEWMKQHGR